MMKTAPSSQSRPAATSRRMQCMQEMSAPVFTKIPVPGIGYFLVDVPLFFGITRTL